MKGKYYTIQIIPEDSHEIKKYRISTKWFVMAKVALAVFIVVAAVFIFNLAKINRIVASYEKMRVTNAQLIKKDNNYEEMFSRLDSLWVMENRIQNIFETFIENDSGKINSIIDRNRFSHTPNERIEVDYEGIHGWQPQEEKVRLERIPSILPVVGLLSKKFSEDEEHLGVDFSAQQGNPVYATGSGSVEFAGYKEDLGNNVIIDHKNGYKSTYSHLKEIRVRKGWSVSKGNVIGTIGSTGNTSGNHLHYEIIKDGVKQDPEKFFNF